MAKSELLVEVLENGLQTAKIGLIVKGFGDISPAEVLLTLSHRVTEKIYAVAVGYECSSTDSEKLLLSLQVEDAVRWRSDPEYARKIVVFISNDSDKLHSLKELDVVTVRAVSERLISNCASKQINTPSREFWEALKTSLDSFSFESLCEFAQSVENDITPDGTPNADSIPNNMWRLGLLSDKTILGAKVKPEEQLAENRKLIIAIGQISEAHRKRLSTALAKATPDDRGRYQAAYRNLQNFFKYGNRETLKELDYTTVRELLTATKPAKQHGNASGGQGGGTTIEKIIREKELNEIVSRCTVLSYEENKDYLSELLEKVRNHFKTGDTEIGQIGGEFENRKIVIDRHDTALPKLVCQFCSQENWGGIMQTEEMVLRDVVAGSIISSDMFQPEMDTSLTSYDNTALFVLLRRFDDEFKNRRLTDTTFEFSPIIADLVACRDALLANLELIMYFPILAFGTDGSLKSSLYRYTEKWTELLRVFNSNESVMHTISHNVTRSVARSLLLLDVIFIKTPTEWKGILLPLHPLFLWRYYEVFKSIDSSEEFSEKDAENLAKVFTDLPQVLNFLVVDNCITTDNTNVELPCSGAIEMLPTFENKTNRYLGSDGIECVEEIISRWLVFAPYTQKEVRICTVDAPSNANVLKSLKDYLQKNAYGKVVYTIFLTRGQNGNAEMAKLEYDSKDYEIAEYIRQGKLLVSIRNVSNLQEVKSELTLRPVHVAFYFDQSSYSIEHGPTTQQLYINPLVVTYDYEYDTLTHRGEIFPSTDMESGIIGDYHKLMRTADLTSFNRTPRPTYNPDADIRALLTTVKDKQAVWLVAADRTISNYIPAETIPIGEKRYGHRTVGIWASKDSRILEQYMALLRKYNLYPRREVLLRILSDFGHISSDGLISIPRSGGDSVTIDNRRKGLIGTVFTAKYYSKKHPNSLIASLDTHDARLWLRNNDIVEGDERADLIGLRYEENTNTLFIEPIEVKTRDESPDACVSISDNGDRVLEGHAADQIASVILMIREMFEGGIENMFTSARKEVLKFQIVSECFRDLHDHDWQQKWDSVFKRLFGKNRASELNVVVRGKLVHVKLGEPTSQPPLTCKHKSHLDCEIDFVTLTTRDIQEYIFETDSQPSIDWNNPDFDNSGGAPNNEEDISAYYDEDNSASGYRAAPQPIITQEQEEHRSEIPDEVQSVPIESSGTSVANNKPFTQSAEPVCIEEITKLANDFKRSCNGYGIQIDQCESNKAIIGSSVIRFPFKLSRGQRIAVLRDRLEDIGREMRRNGVLVQTDANSDTFLDVPRTSRDTVLFADVIDSIPEVNSPEQLYFPLGRTPDGRDIFKNLKECPHLLVGGSTGSGKSVFLYTLLCAILRTHPNANDCQILLSSSKREDFVYFEGLPQLVGGRVFADAGEMTELFKDFIYKESERRGDLLISARKRDIDAYNQAAEKKLAPLVVIVDEFADLTDQLSSRQEKNDFYTPIRKIAQAGRSRGIHLVLCTQRPSADLVPSNIKAQLNGRLALRVNDAIASRMIIDDNGAERLQKHGDMLYKTESGTERVQGYFISIEEVEQIVVNILNRE
ncbi:FtsK/SpoIIIE domain-containing protein [Desulfoscipio gibsoniae]